MNKKPEAVEQLKERFRREAEENKEATIGRIVYSLIQEYGDVSYDAIRKHLCRMIQDAPSAHGAISPELDVQLHNANAALVFLLLLHEPHDGR